MALRQELEEALRDIGCEVTTVEHPAAPTVEEHTKYVGHLGGGQAKQVTIYIYISHT